MTSVLDSELTKRLAASKITLEVCPASNVALGVAADPADVPLPGLLAEGVPVALGADDPLLFGSRLASQYEIARQAHGLSDADLAELARMSVRGSAAPPSAARRLLAGIDTWLARPPPLLTHSLARGCGLRVFRPPGLGPRGVRPVQCHPRGSARHPRSTALSRAAGRFTGLGGGAVSSSVDRSVIRRQPERRVGDTVRPSWPTSPRDPVQGVGGPPERPARASAALPAPSARHGGQG